MDTPEEKPSPLDDVEVQKAAGYYSHLQKSIRTSVVSLNKKGLSRVLVALADFPYAQSYPKFRTDLEQHLFTYMLAIQTAKATIAKALEADMTEIKTEAENKIVEEQLEVMNGKVE